MRINYKSGRSVNAGFSDKVDAEFINRAVFRINDKLNDKAVFYKCGLVFLSGCDSSLETELKKIDNLTGMIDLLLLKNDNPYKTFFIFHRKRLNGKSLMKSFQSPSRHTD